MKPDSNQLFYSKILLFGEYSLIVGSMALSIPFTQFSGRFVRKPNWQIAEGGKKSNFQLEKFAAYLENFLGKGDKFSIDLERFKSDISKGLVFQSNIPQRYGLGSSGAVVAAVYKDYGSPQFMGFSNAQQIITFRKYLAVMESFFHGKSSGLDPLISYLKKPLLIGESGNIEIPELPKWVDDKPGAIFLVDSGSPAETQPLVDHFLDNCKDEEFMGEISSSYIPLVNSSIESYCKNQPDELNNKMHLLSEYQLENFDLMIPGSVKEIWEKGLESRKYLLKLCGSGGGGMVLGFTEDFDFVQQELKNWKLTHVHSV
jgi:mevalonate kinase